MRVGEKSIGVVVVCTWVCCCGFITALIRYTKGKLVSRYLSSEVDKHIKCSFAGKPTEGSPRERVRLLMIK